MFTLEQIEKYTHGNIVNGNKNMKISDFSIFKGTRKQKDYFFIPIVFKGIDREEYILNHVKNGCMGFMISKNSKEKEKIKEEAIQLNPNICILEVEKINDALLELGKISREENINKPVIAVTGSFGKITICSLISQILATEIKVLHDFKNENNNTKSHISLSYLFFENYDMAVTEVGISSSGIMPILSELTKPSIAVINAIGTAHINNFKKKENVLKEKMHITDYLKDEKILFVNADDEYLKNVKQSNEYELRYYSLEEAKDISQKDGKINFTTSIYGRNTKFDLNLYGVHHIRNIILAIKIAEIYHISYENIVKAINDFKPVKGRFKTYTNRQSQITLIDDTYNSCFESAINGLEIANQMKSIRKIAVLGTIGSGAYGKEDTSKVHEQLGNYFKNLDFDALYLTGDFTKHIFKGALNIFPERNIRRFKTKELLQAELVKNIQDGDLIYIKEAGLQGFEEIVNSLKEKFDLI